MTIKKTFKVGDKVTIRSDLKEGELNGGLHINKIMLKYRGKTLTITKKEVVSGGGHTGRGDYEEYNLNTNSDDDMNWTWVRECFTEIFIDSNKQHYMTCSECDTELSTEYIKTKGILCPKCKKSKERLT